MLTVHGWQRAKTLGFPVRYDLALPDAALEGARVPVTLLLHDLGQGLTQWRDQARLARLVEGFQVALLMPEGRRSCFVDMAHGPQWNAFLRRELLGETLARFNLRPQDAWVVGLGSGALGALALAAQAALPYALIDPAVESAFAWQEALWPRRQEWLGVMEGKQAAWQGLALPRGLWIGEAAALRRALSRWPEAKADVRPVPAQASLEEKLALALAGRNGAEKSAGKG